MKRDCDRCGLRFEERQLRPEVKGTTTLRVCPYCWDERGKPRTELPISAQFVKHQYVDNPYDRLITDTVVITYRAITAGLYPVQVYDTMSAAGTVANGELKPVLFTPTMDDTLSTTATLGSVGILQSQLPTLHVIYDVDTLSTTATLGATGTLRSSLITHVTYDIDTLSATGALGTTGELRTSLIAHNIYDTDTLTVQATLGATGTLA